MYSGVGKKVPAIRSRMQYEHMLQKAEANLLSPEEKQDVLDYEAVMAQRAEEDKLTVEWVDNIESNAFKTVQILPVDFGGNLKFMLTTIESEDFICELKGKTHAMEVLYAIGGTFNDPATEG